jgi:hypothetical protein
LLKDDELLVVIDQNDFNIVSAMHHDEYPIVEPVYVSDDVDGIRSWADVREGMIIVWPLTHIRFTRKEHEDYVDFIWYKKELECGTIIGKEGELFRYVA